jgi:cold shock CspA family protein
MASVLLRRTISAAVTCTAPLDARFLSSAAAVVKGQVKWFNEKKGYGFISPADKGLPEGAGAEKAHYCVVLMRCRSVCAPNCHPVHWFPIPARRRGGECFPSPCAILPATLALQVEFELVESDRGVQAAHVTGPGGAPLDRAADERPAPGSEEF